MARYSLHERNPEHSSSKLHRKALARTQKLPMLSYAYKKLKLATLWQNREILTIIPRACVRNEMVASRPGAKRPGACNVSHPTSASRVIVFYFSKKINKIEVK